MGEIKDCCIKVLNKLLRDDTLNWNLNNNWFCSCGHDLRWFRYILVDVGYKAKDEEILDRGVGIPHMTSWKEQFIWLNEAHQKLKQKLADVEYKLEVCEAVRDDAIKEAEECGKIIADKDKKLEYLEKRGDYYMDKNIELRSKIKELEELKKYRDEHFKMFGKSSKLYQQITKENKELSSKIQTLEAQVEGREQLWQDALAKAVELDNKIEELEKSHIEEIKNMDEFIKKNYKFHYQEQKDLEWRKALESAYDHMAFGKNWEKNRNVGFRALLYDYKELVKAKSKQKLIDISSEASVCMSCKDKDGVIDELNSALDGHENYIQELRSKIKELKFCNCGDSTENKPECDTCVMTDEDDIKEQKELEHRKKLSEKVHKIFDDLDKAEDEDHYIEIKKRHLADVSAEGDIRPSFISHKKIEQVINKELENAKCFKDHTKEKEFWCGYCYGEQLIRHLKKELLDEKKSNVIVSTFGELRSGMSIPALHMSNQREGWFEFLKSIEWGVTASCNAKWKGRIKQTIGELDDIFNWFDMLPQAYDEGLTDIGKGNKTLTMIFEKAQRWKDLKKGFLDCSEKDECEHEWEQGSPISPFRCVKCLKYKDDVCQSEKPSGSLFEKWTKQFAKKVKEAPEELKDKKWLDEDRYEMLRIISNDLRKVIDGGVIDKDFIGFVRFYLKKLYAREITETKFLDLIFVELEKRFKQKIFGSGEKRWNRWLEEYLKGSKESGE